MAKKGSHRKSRKSKKKELSRSEQIAARLDRMSRGSRIMLNMWTSIAVSVLIGLPVVLLFSRDVNQLEQGEILYAPTIIVAVLWLVVYAYGWWALVGFDWDPEVPWRARQPAVAMLVVSVIASFLLVLEAVVALMFGFVL